MKVDNRIGITKKRGAKGDWLMVKYRHRWLVTIIKGRVISVIPEITWINSVCSGVRPSSGLVGWNHGHHGGIRE